MLYKDHISLAYLNRLPNNSKQLCTILRYILYVSGDSQPIAARYEIHTQMFTRYQLVSPIDSLQPLYLSKTFLLFFLHLLNSRGVIAVKAQQLPQLPWFLTAGRHIWSL